MCHGQTIVKPKRCRTIFVKHLKCLKKRVEMTTNEVHGKKEFQQDVHHLKVIAIKIIKAGIAGSPDMTFKCTVDELTLA